MADDLITEDEARKLLFSKDARPSKAAFARMRRLNKFPHVKLGRRVLYWRSELEKTLRRMKG